MSLSLLGNRAPALAQSNPQLKKKTTVGGLSSGKGVRAIIVVVLLVAVSVHLSNSSAADYNAYASLSSELFATTAATTSMAATNRNEEYIDAIRWIERKSIPTDKKVGRCLAKGKTDVSNFDNGENNKIFNCSYTMKLPPVYLCPSTKVGFATHPYRWECRLKVRIMERIDRFGLRQTPFLMMDLGSCTGDWALAIGVYARKAVLVNVDANAVPFHKSYIDFDRNDGLDDRVHGLLAALMSTKSFNEHKGPLLVDDKWQGPVLCDDGSDRSGTMNVTGMIGGCNQEGLLRIPMITIDMIVAAHTPGAWFFMKLDIEGSEYNALQGGLQSFADPQLRPCIIMIELKADGKGDSYSKAFDLLISLGYTDVEDIDTGREGPESYPPLGRIFPREGNYEFKLPEKELRQCVARVQETSTESIPVPLPEMK